MSKTLNSDIFGEKLYNTLPLSYRRDDEEVELALKRYLMSLSSGGFSKTIDELNGILDLNDPEKMPEEVIKVVFRQYGLEVFEGLPELYLRKLLPYLGDLYSRKGAISVIEYLTSLISNTKSEVVLSPNFKEDYTLNINIEMDYENHSTTPVSKGDDSSLLGVGVLGSMLLNKRENDIPDIDQMLRVIKEFVPFFINAVLVFTYMFYENANLSMTDAAFDSNLFKYDPITDSSRLSVSEPSATSYDNIKVAYEEFGTIGNSTITSLDSVLNTSKKLNVDFITNGEASGSDSFTDVIKYIK